MRNLIDNINALLIDGDLPLPGDLIVAKFPMHSWETEATLGHDGINVETGDVGIVVGVWQHNQRIRLRLLINDRTTVFSLAPDRVSQCWTYGEPLNSPKNSPGSF